MRAPKKYSPATGIPWESMAQYYLGSMYVNGEGVEKDYSRAVELFQKAAEQGHLKAQTNLGVMYYKGEGVSADLIEARKWFQKAAQQGDENAIFNLERIVEK